MTATQPLTQLEFSERDFEIAEAAAKRLGYTQTAYTSTSALWGLFCLPDRPSQREGCFVKTKELGLLFVSNLEDLKMHDLEACERATPIRVASVDEMEPGQIYTLPAWSQHAQHRATAWSYLNRDDGGSVVFANGKAYSR